jgi:hypothetical protein
VRRIVFLNHLDAGAAVFGDLVDVRTFQQAPTNVCVPQAVSPARSAIAVNAEIFLVQNRLEKFALPFRKNEVCRFRQAQFLGFGCCGVGSILVARFLCTRRTEPGFQPFERTHGAMHALAVADASLAPYLDLKDRSLASVVFDNCHVPKLEAPRLIGPEACIGGEQHTVVKLLAFPFESAPASARARAFVAS